MKKNILIDLERLRYPNSGIANVFKNLVLGLGKKENIVVYGPVGNIMKIGNFFKIEKWNSLHKFYAPFQNRYNIVHVSHQLSSYFHRKSKGQKKIVTLHDLNFLHENLTDAKKNKIRKIVNKNIGNADIIVCISDFVKQDFLLNKNLFLFSNEPKVEVVYNGIDIPKYIEVENKKFNFLKEKNFILNIGVLFPKKNQISLLRMITEIKEDLVLVTSDAKNDYEQEILQFIQKNNLSDRVHIFKNISDEEKMWLLKNCCALGHPSLAEGFGIPPIEAMSFGKPIFLSNLTSLPEIGGDLAFYFDDFDPKNMAETFCKGMEVFYKSPKDYSQKLKARASIFSSEKMAEEYYKIYERLLKTTFKNS